MLMSYASCLFFFFNDTATTEIYTLSLHDALPIFRNRPKQSRSALHNRDGSARETTRAPGQRVGPPTSFCRCEWHRSEEHTSELQSRLHLVCRLLLEKKKKKKRIR